MTVTIEIGTLSLVELIKQIQSGNEVVLTQDAKPVAKLVAASAITAASRIANPIPLISGHQVLIPNVSQAELAEEMFD